MATQSLPRFPAKPHQPRTISFPKHSFGKTRVVQVAFKATWFDKWSWINYDESTDNAFCHICVKAEEDGKLKANSKDLAFLSVGFPTGKTPQIASVATSKVSATKMLSR